MVEQERAGERAGVTVDDIARRYRRTTKYVRGVWTTSEEWRRRVPRVGKEGKRILYDAKAVEALVSEWVWVPPTDPPVPAHRLLDQRAIAEYAGIAYETVRSDATEAKGVLGPPDEVRDGVRLWRRSTVDERYWARKRVHRAQGSEARGD